MIWQEYNRVINIESDIQHNLPILRYFALQCKHITEMGVRAMVSSWALLDGLSENGIFIGIDWENPSKYGITVNEIINQCKDEGINFKFIEANTLKIEIESTDFLFIDTIHTKEQLSKELELHANKVKKFIAFHDTVSCPEIRLTIDDFLNQNKNWKIVFDGYLSNGLLVIQKNA